MFKRSTPATSVAATAGAAGLALAAFATIAYTGVDQPHAADAAVSPMAATAAPAPAAPAVPAAFQAPIVPVAPVVQPAPAPAPAAPVYTNDLDGWIRQAIDILHANNIPASYDGIYRNIMRESTGNPQAINLYDSNAAAGIPSKGLLQVIDPTFRAFHIAGTSDDIYDPVANIVAACNYAANRYGSMDNVNSSY
ncbi:hypothetical protein FOY51_11040 [Antrihabitans cavernicola]|uniref:Transglycosylase SLT domain-containing protein n=2 Tax=Antrihabitans cavernicola TaxID=2495913 RepID=A0A5A7SG01_9NOCA|nr:hypothetical protein FOY51_11040 [Spelaeibacter cavernicola]